MKKKLFLKFFVLAVIGAFVTFTSCKDYDDDISGLKTELNQIKQDLVKNSDLEALKTQLESKIAALESKMATKDDLALYVKLEAYNSFKASVEAEIATLKADLAKAATKEEVAAIEASLKSEINAVKMDLLAKISNIEAILKIVGDESGVIKDIQKDLADQLDLINQNKADIATINGEIDGIMARLTGIDAEIANIWKELNSVKDLLRSMELLTEDGVNGYDAIGFNPIAYTHCTKETTQLANPKYVTAQYILNPSTVKESDIDTDNLSFLYQYKENKFKSAAIAAKADFVSLDDGVLTVGVVIDANFAEEAGWWASHNPNPGQPGSIDKMDQIALQVPLLGAGAGEVITSPFYRIDVDAKDNVQIDRVGKLCGADNTTYSGNYYSVTAAKAETTPYLLELVWDKQHNLLDYVTSTADLFGDCAEFDPADYGLVWNFDLKDENDNVFKYLLDSNETDQQEFIKLTGNQGIIDSKVYDTSGTDAIGRTPIVRVQIIDPATKCVVSQGFVKIKWVKENPVFDAEYPAQKVDFTCDTANPVEDAGAVSAISFKVKTQWMNVNVYNKMGTFYKEFYHNNNLDEYNIYDEDGEPVDWGYVVGNPDTQEGENEVTDLFTIYLADVCELADATKFEGYVHYVSKMDNDVVTVRVKVTLDVTMPQLGIYEHLGTYWKEGNTVFTLNPITYGSQADPQPNPTASYKTNLLNGFGDKDGNIPASAVEAIKESALKGDFIPCDDAQFEFDPVKLKDYSFTVNGTVYSVANNNLQLANNNLELRFGTGTGILAAKIEVDGDNTYISIDEAGQEPNVWTTGGDPQTEGSWPNEFARALVGNDVPVRLVANLCCEIECLDPVVVKQFKVKFIKPLSIDGGLSKDFVDAAVNGSVIEVGKALTYTDWNFYGVRATAYSTSEINANPKLGFAPQLYNYYEVLDAVWDTDNIKSNLKLVGDTRIPTEGVTDGAIPLKAGEPVYKVVHDGTTNTLTFYNNGGTIDPTTPPLKLYIPVSVKHKWGTESKVVEVQVLPAAGNTP